MGATSGNDSGHACPEEVHEAIKRDEARWYTETKPLPGCTLRSRVLAVSATFVQEWANCVRCGGTMARRLPDPCVGGADGSSSQCVKHDGLPIRYDGYCIAGWIGKAA